MEIHHLSYTSSILTTYLSEIRDKEIQKDGMRFRRNLQRISEIIGYEISKTLEYKMREVETPLKKTHVPTLVQQPVIATILRAGLAMHTGMMNVFDHADSAFISAFRKNQKEDSSEFEVDIEYMSAPSLDGKVIILSDPMLATGSSMLAVYRALLSLGKPKRIILAVTIATPEAIAFLEENIQEEIEIYAAVIDEGLNEHFYILPGLGDAGDLAFGIKK